MNVNSLIWEAIRSREKAYVPYSHFMVGAAVLSESGKIYGGCNIECSSYSVSVCAERTAILRAIYEGEKRLTAIAVVGGDQSKKGALLSYCPPCGVCRQMMREFCDSREFKVIVAKSENEYKVFTMDEILPMSFGPDNLKKQDSENAYD